MSKKRNTQIPEEAIDRDAKIENDETKVVVIDPRFIFSLGVTKMVNDSAKERVLSTSLDKGVVIKVEDNSTLKENNNIENTKE